MADSNAPRDHSAMLANPLFDADLLHRYDRPGPRYTSYPTAPQFTFDFDESALRKVVRESNDDPIPRSLSIYVHVPFCASPCFYCGCNRIITRDRSLAEAYVARLVREIAMTAEMFDRDRDVIQLHFGENGRHFEGVVEIGLARGPRLVTVRLHRIDIGPVEQVLIRVRIIFDDPFNQFILAHHRASLR